MEERRMRSRLIILSIAVLLFASVMIVPQFLEASKSSAATVAPTPVQGRSGQQVTVGESIRNDTSAPVREMKQQPVFKPRKEANENPKIPHFHRDAPDRVVQNSVAVDQFTASNMPATDLNF